MWPFKKTTTLLSSGLFDGFTDCHSHILPGVDDGVRNMEESLAILARYESLGMKSVWLTPHIMEDYPNEPADLSSRFEELCSAYHGKLELHLGAENMLDSLFDGRLAERNLLPMGPKGDHLLVETSYFTPPFGFHETLEKIKSMGYFPVLAHPERYVYMDMKDYDALKRMNIQFQLNAFSLAGFYGKSTKLTAEALLKKGYYDYAGTDIHSMGMLTSSLDRPVESKLLYPMKAL